MPGGGEGWSTQQLIELLAHVSSFTDEASAMRGAIERAAEAVEAEAAALIRDGRVVASVGFPAGEVPEAALVGASGGHGGELELTGLGECHAACVPVDGSPAGRMVVARAGTDAFDREETALLRGMARVLSLSLQTLRLLEEERRLRSRSEEQAAENVRLVTELSERQMLLERLSRIQRSIVERANRDDVLDAIVSGASELLGVEVVSLRLIDPGDSTHTVSVASKGLPDELLDKIRRLPVGQGAGGRAAATNELVVMEQYDAPERHHLSMARAGIKSAMAAPVQEEGRPIGSLTVASHDDGRTYSATEQEVLVAFAKHASLAITDAKMVEEVLRRAYHDDLTGLANRALLLDLLRRSGSRVSGEGNLVAMLFMDLDRFKNVNDSFGHAAGDALLRSVARRLNGTLRAGGTAARLGGDEFAVLLEVGKEADAVTVAKRIQRELQAPFAVGGTMVSVSASIGVAFSQRPEEDLLRNADLAMYRAKSLGPGRFELYEPSMHTSVVERLELENELRGAIEADELVLHYQPVIALRTGKVVGLEALVRWRHPTRGLMVPDEFIPLAEETGLILPIGDWVLRQACRQLSEWISLDPDLTVAVNLSAVQLRSQDLPSEVAGALSAGAMTGERLMLELTETAFMKDVASTQAMFTRLKALGVRTAIDDFGTGYSSFAYLRRFPVDVLKIAKPFIDNIAGAAAEPALPQAIVDVARGLDMDVIAEGIEHGEQVARVLELGCELGQGFYLARPADAAVITGVLADRRRPGRLVPLATGSVMPTG